jgi:hypothetical protein
VKPSGSSGEQKCELPSLRRPTATHGAEPTRCQAAAPAGTPPVDAAAEVVRLRELVAQLQTALDSRIVIEQAKGILAERLAIDVDQAFELLRRAARRNRMRIHLVASAVTTSPATPAEITTALSTGRQSNTTDNRAKSRATKTQQTRGTSCGG